MSEQQAGDARPNDLDTLMAHHGVPASLEVVEATKQRRAGLAARAAEALRERGTVQ